MNDSMATTPTAAIAALAALTGPVVLLAGGSDKGADFGELGLAAARGADAVVCLGAVGGRIADAVEAGEGAARVVRCEGSFEEAFAAALRLCPPRGSILLAPGTASYDMFANFKVRGERFRELALTAAAG